MEFWLHSYDHCSVTHKAFVIAVQALKKLKQIELTSKLVLAIIALTAVSAMLVPTYAVPTIRSADIFDGEVKTADLANNAVTSPKIKNGEVKAEDIAAGVIPSGGVQPTVHRVDGETVTVGPGPDDASATAVCPDGEIATGGGYVGNPVTILTLSAPNSEGNGWFASVHTNFSGETEFHGVVQCMDFSP